MDGIKSQSLSISISPENDEYSICNFTVNRCKPIHISVTPNISIDSSNSQSKTPSDSPSGSSGDITFSLMVTQSAISILSDGVSVPSTVSMAGGRRLFRFTVDVNAVDTVQITVSALSPNENVLISVFPTNSISDDTVNATTKWMYSASESVIISNLSALCIHSMATSTTMCTMLVSVEMVNGNEGEEFAFNVVATTGRAFRTLQDGVTITDSITRSRSFKYYNFYANLDDAAIVGDTVLEIDVDPSYGYVVVRMFAKRNGESDMV